MNALSVRRRLLPVPLLTAALVCSVGTSVSAAENDNRAVAEGLFEAGRESMEAADYAAACPKFRQSHELDPAVGTLLNLALCYKEQGRSASAWSTYREAAALARDNGQKEREQLARKEASALEAELIRLKVILPAKVASLEGVTVTRGDHALPSASWGVPLPIDPGTIEVLVTAPGYESWNGKVEADGSKTYLELTVPTLKQIPEKSEVTSAPSEESPRSVGAAPWIIGGVGLAGVATGTFFAFSAKSNNDDAKDICVDTPSSCPIEDINRHEELLEDARRNRTIAFIGWGVGAAAIGGAVIWLLLDSPSTPTSTAFTISPTANRSAFGLTAQGTF